MKYLVMFVLLAMVSLTGCVGYVVKWPNQAAMRCYYLCKNQKVFCERTCGEGFAAISCIIDCDEIVKNCAIGCGCTIEVK